MATVYFCKGEYKEDKLPGFPVTSESSLEPPGEMDNFNDKMHLETHGKMPD